MSRSQCAAITAAGTQCSRHSIIDQRFCGQHSVAGTSLHCVDNPVQVGDGGEAAGDSNSVYEEEVASNDATDLLFASLSKDQAKATLDRKDYKCWKQWRKARRESKDTHSKKSKKEKVKKNKKVESVKPEAKKLGKARAKEIIAHSAKKVDSREKLDATVIALHSPGPNEVAFSHRTLKRSSSFSGRFARARGQKLFLINRTRNRDRSGFEQEAYSVLGSTGNVYEVVIGRHSSCSCPDDANPCKHIIFVLLKVLGIPEHSDLITQSSWYQSEVLAMLNYRAEVRKLTRGHDVVDERAVLAAPVVRKALGAELSRAEEKAAGKELKKRESTWRAAVTKELEEALEAEESARQAVSSLGTGAKPAKSSGLRPRNLGDPCTICFDDLPTEGRFRSSDLIMCSKCQNAVHLQCQVMFQKHNAAQGALCSFCRTPYKQKASKADSAAAVLQMREHKVQLLLAKLEAGYDPNQDEENDEDEVLDAGGYRNFAHIHETDNDGRRYDDWGWWNRRRKRRRVRDDDDDDEDDD